MSDNYRLVKLLPGYDLAVEHMPVDPPPRALPLLYIAGPYSSDPVDGTRRAVEAADHLWFSWSVPAVVPHLSILHDLMAPRPYEAWIALDLALVERCDAVWRLAGVSAGADREEAHAIDRGIPVLRTDSEVRDFIERWPA